MSNYKAITKEEEMGLAKIALSRLAGHVLMPVNPPPRKITVLGIRGTLKERKKLLEKKLKKKS